MLRLIFLAFLSLSAIPARAESGASYWVRQPEVAVRLLSASQTAGHAPTLDLGLEIEMKPGWHTYWRSPGDAGAPASLDWTGSTGLSRADTLWPAPKRMVSQGIETVGYDYSPLILPIRVTRSPESAELLLRAKLDLLVCAELCIPYSFDLSLDLPAGAPQPTPFAERLAKWSSRVPRPAPESLIELRSDGQGLIVHLNTQPELTDPDILVESAAGYRFGKPQPAGRDGSAYIYKIPLLSKLRDGAALDRETYRLTVLDTTQNLDIAEARPVARTPESAPHRSRLTALLAALLGGLILNLMPCVLPVLSLKVLSIVSHAGAPPRHVRLSFLANAAGIITSFLLLALVAIGLKQAGISVGWGVQFQHPAFIIPMVAILTLFAASLWNLIEIPLPRFLADAINDRLPSPGEAHDRTLTGNFITGAFATLLATPCSAPLVGTAIGFAFTGTALDLLLVALAMGVGLALPYLLIAAFPHVARFLPRPGRWMLWLRNILGLALALTALWLAGVLSQQIGVQDAQMVSGSVVLFLLALWIRACFAKPLLFVKGVGVFAVLAIIALNAHRLPFLRDEATSSPPLQWQAFDEASIPTLIAQGYTVFVDVTADWCLTCHVNERFVLNAEPTRTRLSASHIIRMKADWTSRSDTIGAYLAKFGRYGIPFNIVYGPGAPQGVVLPELLSAAKIDDALNTATGILTPETTSPGQAEIKPPAAPN